MTKPRPALSVEDALDRIAGQIPGGKRAMAAIVDRQPRTVHNWGDPDTPETIPMDCAIKLDIAFQQHGGVGHPIFDTYALLLETAELESFSCGMETARRLKAAMKEGSEAHAALVDASLPGATKADRERATREVLEAVDALKATLPTLTDGTGPAGNAGEGKSPVGGEP
jgi:hypothetical protein